MSAIGKKSRLAMPLLGDVLGENVDRLRLAAFCRHLNESGAIIGGENNSSVLAPTAANKASCVAKNLRIAAGKIRTFELAVRTIGDRLAIRGPERLKRIV